MACHCRQGIPWKKYVRETLSQKCEPPNSKFNVFNAWHSQVFWPSSLTQIDDDAPRSRRLSSAGLLQTGESLYAPPFTNATDLIGFGTSVALAKNDGSRLAVGAPLWDGGGQQGGAVFVYDYDGNEWGEPIMIVDAPIGHQLGERLSLSADGSRLAVRYQDAVKVIDVESNEVVQTIASSGATVTLSYDGSLVAVSEEGFQNGSGRVVLYSMGRDSDDWQEGPSFVGVDPLERFGWSTSFNEAGDRLAISAPNFDSENLVNRGLVRVYEKIDGNWTQIGQDLLGDEDSEQFGFSLELSGDGNTLISGSPGSPGGGVRRGTVSTFVWTNDIWVEIGYGVNGTDDNDRFGRSVAISGNGTHFVGSSFFHDAQRGQIRFFELFNSEWWRIDEINGEAPVDRLGFGNFGLSMTLDGTRIAAGAVRALDQDGRPSGQVKIFDDTFEPLHFLPTSTPTTSDSSISPSSSPSSSPTFGVTAIVPSTAPISPTFVPSAVVPTAPLPYPLSSPSSTPTFVPTTIVPATNETTDFQITGCVCNEVRVCSDNAVVPGSVLFLCLDTRSEDVNFVGIDQLSLVEQDLSQFTYRSIQGGIPEFGTAVTFKGSACYIQTPLMTFFDGAVPVQATGVALLQFTGEERYLRTRFLLSQASDFGIDVRVEQKSTVIEEDTSAGVKHIISFALTASFLLVGLLGI
jgi:hypothetical protein